MLARAVHIGFMDQLKAMHADLDDLRSKAKRELGWEPRHPSMARAFAEGAV